MTPRCTIHTLNDWKTAHSRAVSVSGASSWPVDLKSSAPTNPTATLFGVFLPVPNSGFSLKFPDDVPPQVKSPVLHWALSGALTSAAGVAYVLVEESRVLA